MDKDLFEGLVEGVKEAGKVKRGEKHPSRLFKCRSLDVKELREKLKFSLIGRLIRIILNKK